jgi:hypothetical protein
MRHGIPAFALTLLLPSLGFSAPGVTAARPAPAGNETQNVSGRCSPYDHIIHGGLQDGPSDKRTLFVCDNVLVTFQDARRQRVVLEFGVRGSKKNSAVVGFDGTFDWTDDDLSTAKIHQLYLVRGVLNPADDGKCYLRFVGDALTEAQCFATTHRGKKRSVAVVSFKAGR